MKKYLPLVLTSILACSGEFEESFTDEDTGTVEQAITGSTTPSFQHGTQTGSDRNRCNRTSTGQVCVVPSKRVLSVCIHNVNLLSPPSPPPTFTTAESTRIRQIVTNIFEPRAGWTFNVDDVIGDGTFLADCYSRSTPADITIVPGAAGASGSASSNVKDYVTTSFGGLVSLTEGAGVVGQYQRWTTCFVAVDRTDAYAKGTTTNEDNNGLSHAAAHGIAACVGIGTASGIQNDRAARSLFQPSTVATNLTLGESCALDNYSSVLQSQYNQTNSCSQN